MLTLTDQLEKSEARLLQAERCIQELPAEEAQAILGWVLDTRADIALYFGDIPLAVSLALQALELLPETEVMPRVGSLTTSIRTYLVSGDVTSDSEHKVAATVALVRTSGYLYSTVNSTCLLAWLHILQGRLRRAAATFEQVAQVVSRPEVLQTMFSSLFYYFGLGDLLREWNDLVAAEQHLLQGMALIKETPMAEPFVAVLGYTALARLQQARGNIHAALATLEAVRQMAGQRHFPQHLLNRVAAVRAVLELSQGNLGAAISWADSSGLSTEDEDLHYPHEREYLVLAQVRIAQAFEDQASPFLQDVLYLLDRLLRDAEGKARRDSVLEIIALRALALETQGDRTSALSTLERALVLAAPEGYIRLFADAGLAAPGSGIQ